MAPAAAKVLADALALAPEERSELAQALLRSLDDCADAQQRWAAELECRAGEVAAGRAELVPWDDVKVSLRAELERRAGEVAAGF